jgi:AP-1 complex subunit gamma-1
MSIKLRDLIRAVRACKTAAEERAVISKECALIRTAIKEEDEKFRHRNVAKMMFIHMLGYPTHFGQMECLKLISAQTFPEKRIGYLGLTLLLTEQTEVLTLVTNSLKLDLTNPNQYIQALSLITIGNLATQDMARDLAGDVEKLLRSNNSYLRKKAALAAIRLLKKEPDLIEHMSERIVSLLKDRSHGVLVTGIQLMIEVLHLIPETKTEYLKLVPSLVRLLRNFISMGFSPEHDVAGITDPFMQVKILHLLKLLGKGNEEASEQMNDVLAQVATNTETTKNAGNAILYECVQTIMEVESDSSLRVLAVNILGRFLLNRDNNIRYVALNSLSKVVSEDVAAVQRHRNTIVDCLKDPDISIRQRALELIYQLVNEQNVVALTTELLNYLVVAQSEHKASLVSKIIQIVEKYSPSKKWRVDTVVTMLSIAGNITDDSVARTAIIFIAQSEGLQGYATHKLYRNLVEDSSQMGLLQVAIWCMGEYGLQLTRDCPSPDTENSSSAFSAIPESELIAQLDKCTKLHNVDVATKAVVLNAFGKLSVRLSPASVQTIKALIAPFQNSMSLELQQRSAEYTVLLSGNRDTLRKELFDKMPVLDEAALRARRAEFDMNTFDDDKPAGDAFGSSAPSPFAQMQSIPGGSSAEPSLIDLDDIFGGGSSSSSAPTLTPQNNAYGYAPASPAQQAQTNNNDLMAMFATTSPAPVFNQSPYQQQHHQYPPQPPVATANHSIDLLSMGMSSASMSSPNVSGGGMPIIALAPVTNPTIMAFDKGGFQVGVVQ